MQMTSSPESVTTDDPAEARERLFGMDMVRVQQLWEGGKRGAAVALMRSLLKRPSSAEQAGQILEKGAAILGRQAMEALAREQAWALSRRPDVRWEPARDLRRRRGEARLLTREGLAAHKRARLGAAVAEKYWDERDAKLDPKLGPTMDPKGWDGEGPYRSGQRHDTVVTPSERDVPVWGEDVDFEKLAMTRSPWTPCLCCRVERSRVDAGNPDGLCEEGREKGFTRASVIEGYCALIAEGKTAEVALKLLYNLHARFARSDQPADQEVIAAWGRQYRARMAA
jgi:hypothetical protein